MYKVMIVEDEEQIRSGLKKLIEEVIGGFKVIIEARNGLEALESIRAEIPDVVITDIRMKDMNGLEMIDKLRFDFPQLFILIISGYNDFEYTKKAIQYKVEDYMLKPVDRIELAQYLGNLRNKLMLRDGTQLPAAPSDHPSPQRDQEKKIIRQVKEIIQSNLDGDISLQFVANKVHMNRQYLSFLFKMEAGQNFVDYVIQCRMERAKKLLQETNLKVYEIAKLAGYENVKYFVTVFKQIIGTTPTEYRDQQYSK